MKEVRFTLNENINATLIAKIAKRAGKSNFSQAAKTMLIELSYAEDVLKLVNSGQLDVNSTANQVNSGDLDLSDLDDAFKNL